MTANLSSSEQVRLHVGALLRELFTLRRLHFAWHVAGIRRALSLESSRGSRA